MLDQAGLDSRALELGDSAVEGARRRWLGSLEGIGGAEGAGLDAVGEHVVHAVGSGRAGLQQVPVVAPEAVVQDAACTERPEDGQRRTVALVGGAEEGVEAADVVDVKVGQEQGVESAQARQPELRSAAIAAVEQQPEVALPVGDVQVQGVVPEGSPQDAELLDESHDRA